MKFKTLRNKADKLFKEKILELNKYYCEVCGSEAQPSITLSPVLKVTIQDIIYLTE